MPEWVGIVVDRSEGLLRQALEFLETLNKGTVILCGGDRDMDQHLVLEAERQGFKILQYVPHRQRHGREAGMERNRELVDACNRLVIFHDGKSWGTVSTIRYARSIKKPLDIITLESPSASVDEGKEQ